MNNSFYFFINKNIENILIEKLHICTWDLIDEKSMIEFGFEIKGSEIGEKLELFLMAPLLKGAEVSDLSQNLLDTSNSRFIFNDIVSNLTTIDGDNRNGGVIHFANRSNVTVLPAKIDKEEDGIIKITIKIPSLDNNIYFRLLVKTKNKTLALSKSGITKNSYIYDIKINEKRNIPDKTHKFIQNKELAFPGIESVFCLHAIPDSHEITFIDNKKLKNIRKVEIDAFSKYLPTVKSLKNDNYIIIFCKDTTNNSSNNSFSFFNVFSKETIGVSQIIFAIFINIISSTLFIMGSSRINIEKEINWFYVLGFLFILGYIIFLLIKKVKKL